MRCTGERTRQAAWHSTDLPRRRDKRRGTDLPRRREKRRSTDLGPEVDEVGDGKHGQEGGGRGEDMVEGLEPLLPGEHLGEERGEERPDVALAPPEIAPHHGVEGGVAQGKEALTAGEGREGRGGEVVEPAAGVRHEERRDGLEGQACVGAEDLDEGEDQGREVGGLGELRGRMEKGGGERMEGREEEEEVRGWRGGRWGEALPREGSLAGGRG